MNAQGRQNARARMVHELDLYAQLQENYAQARNQGDEHAIKHAHVILQTFVLENRLPTSNIITEPSSEPVKA